MQKQNITLSSISEEYYSQQSSMLQGDESF